MILRLKKSTLEIKKKKKRKRTLGGIGIVNISLTSITHAEGTLTSGSGLLPTALRTLLLKGWFVEKAGR